MRPNSINPGVGYTGSNSAGAFTFAVDQPWTEDFLEPNYDPYDTVHPFKVVNANASTFEVIPGTLNNLPAVEDGTQGATPVYLTSTPSIAWNWDAGTNKSYVYLVAGPNTTTKEYPSPSDATQAYPGVGSWDHTVSSTDDYGYILLAEATLDVGLGVVTVTQYVTGSLWGDRIKLGSSTATYYFARV